MSEINIDRDTLPDLHGRIAVVTGGGKGIGLEIARLLCARGARVYVMSRSPMSPDNLPANCIFIECDISSWASLSVAFGQVSQLDLLFPNAGILPEEDLLVDKFDDQGGLMEPEYPVIDTNLRGTLNTIKWGVHLMRKTKRPGSIVITSSSTGYAPERALAIFSAVKAAQVALVRGLSASLIEEDITINAVAPAATETKLLPPNFAQMIRDAGLPVCDASLPALAAVFSATAQQDRDVGLYPDSKRSSTSASRWNGRVIVSIGSALTEVEGPLAQLRPSWFGQKNDELTFAQQAVTQRLMLEK